MISCPSAEPTQNRATELTNLYTALGKSKTPGKIIDLGCQRFELSIYQLGVLTTYVEADYDLIGEHFE
jgi:hypothetical protein